MPDSDFSVNDVKLFVGKCFCGGNAESGEKVNESLVLLWDASASLFSLPLC